MRRLRAASLIEAVVASVLFMTVFALSLELLPKLSVGRGDELAVVGARRIVERARRKYATGLWPAGEYAEYDDDGCALVVIAPYRGCVDVVSVRITVESGGVKIVHTELAACGE